ncbi:MAG TPA: molybdenum cofactor biosynthesis protein MoaE [Sphingopyxis terrae]|nr:molybdenum cofactor biosynthesis protein MoaE [Sphingopyxis terrae]
MMPMKGYSITAGPGAAAPTVSITDAANRVVFARLGNRMRIAGLADLAHAAADRWRLSALTLIHRVGAMAPGETIVLVLASSPHRAEALAACTFLIDRLKTDVMLWKRETLTDGAARWVEPRAGDQERAEGWD